MAGSLLLQLRSKKPVHNNYLKYVIRGGLKEYEVIEQHGIREGTNLMGHYINGASFIHSIYELLGLSDEECTLLMSAFSIHDLNKLPWGEGKELKKLIDDHDFVKGEIKRTGINNFFLQWEEYFQDILTLIRSHSGHHHLSGDFLIPASDKTKLGYKRLEKLSLLMKAADISDLSPSFTMDKFKSDILDYINAFGAGQFEYIYHSVSEHRGILTNVIHNAIAKVFKDEFYACPLFIYPCGTYYLKKKSPVNGNGLYEKIAGEVDKNLGNMRLEKIDEIIELTKDGIKVNSTVLSIINQKNIIEGFNVQVFKRKFKIDNEYKKCKEKIQQKHGINIDNYLKENGLKFPEIEDEMQKGELIRAVDNFIKMHFTNKEIIKIDNTAKESYDIIFKSLEISNKKPFEIFDKVYLLPFIIGANCNKSYDELTALFLDIIDRFLKIKQNNKGEIAEESKIAEYLKYAVNLSVTLPENKWFSDIFRAYVKNNHKQSCLGSGLGKTSDMMATEVPKNLLVQQFSNRLMGGAKGDPKRYIDSISKEQLFLEKLNFKSGINKKACYFHFFPDKGFTSANLENLKFSLEDWRAQSEGAILRLDYSSLSEDTGNISLVAAKGIGFSLPKYSQTVGNIITLPIYTGSDGVEHFLTGLGYSLMLSFSFNLKCIFTECPVPPLDSNSLIFYYPDGVPFQLHKLIYPANSNEESGRSLSKKESMELLKSLVILIKLERNLRAKPTDSVLYKICTAFSDSLLKFLYQVDRLIENKDRGYTNPIIDYITNLITRRCNMEEKKLSDYLSRLAELGWKEKIKGKSLERNSLLYPVNELFDVLRKESSFLDRETLKATSVDKIFQHLARIADEYKPGKTKYEKVEAFVKVFFELYQDIFKGESSHLFSHEKEIKSAYNYYLNKEMSKSKIDKQNKEDKQ
jgi:CRISPR-associated protein Csc3